MSPLKKRERTKQSEKKKQKYREKTRAEIKYTNAKTEV